MDAMSWLVVFISYLLPVVLLPLLLAAEGIQRSARLRAAPVRRRTPGQENTGC